VDIRIDTLRVQAAGMSPVAARQFGRLLAEQLAALVAAAPPGDGATRLTTLRVSVPAPAGRPQHPGRLAPGVAAEVSRALNRASAGPASAEMAPVETATAVRTAPKTRPGAAR